VVEGGRNGGGDEGSVAVEALDRNLAVISEAVDRHD